MVVLMNERNFRKRSEMRILLKIYGGGGVDFVLFQVKIDESPKPDNSLFKSDSFSLYYRKTPKYKTPSVMNHSSWIQRPNRPEEIKRLSFDCCTEADGTLAESVTYAISPGEGENIEDKIQECLLQLKKVSTIY